MLNRWIPSVQHLLYICLIDEFYRWGQKEVLTHKIYKKICVE